MDINVITTKGKNFELGGIEAETWSEVVPFIEKEIGSISGMKVRESINSTELNLDSRIPQQDFTVFITPVKTKSGSYSELLATVKANPSLLSYCIEKYGPIETLVSSELENAIESYNKKNSGPTVRMLSEEEVRDKIIYEVEDDYEDDYDEED